MPLTTSTAKKGAAAASLGAAAYLGYRHLQHQRTPVPVPSVPEPPVPTATPLYPASIIYQHNTSKVKMKFKLVPTTDENVINYNFWLLDPKTEKEEIKVKINANEKDVNLIANTKTQQMEFNTDDKTYFGFDPVPIKNEWYANKAFIPKGWTLKSVDDNTMACSFIDLC